MFCFFKQKTAYEMRISDWSSDVCSSDLPEHLHRNALGQRVMDAAIDRAHIIIGLQVHRNRGGDHLLPPRRIVRHHQAPRPDDLPEALIVLLQEGGDRKSVVEGKSVSVRVDLGGRRIIKKKTQKTR